MTLKKVIEKCSALSIYEKRFTTDTYCERVFYSKDTKKWDEIFISIFGQPIKPAGINPTKENLLLTEDYGGIYGNQTLYKKEFDNLTAIAMFWPWQDGLHTTLKMAVLEK
ncbi:MAG: hypothetical protein U9R31_01155 [Candidatus Omnitrophota bacterium]|nr:hypothetical protein [Candidatus Omnitrophota bacterium]